MSAPLHALLLERGFTSNPGPEINCTTYTLGNHTLRVYGDVSTVKLKCLNTAHDAASYTRLYLGKGQTYAIETLTLSGNNSIHLPRSVTIERLHCSNSDLDGLYFDPNHTAKYTQLILRDSHVEDLTLELNDPANLVEIEKSTVEHISIVPKTGEDTNSYVHLQYCTLDGDCAEKLTVSTSLIGAHSGYTGSYIKGTLIFSKQDITGTIHNLRGVTIPYHLTTTADGQPYLLLGCWTGTLYEARTLIEGPAIYWPSYGSDYDGSEAIAYARRRYLALLDYLETTLITWVTT